MNERGVVLLEVLLAMAILSMVGVSAVSFIAAGLDAQARLEDRESELVAAERVLIATSLLTRRELDQRLGRRDLARFVVWVDRPEPSLFRVGVSPQSQPSFEILSTLVFRPREDAQ